MSQWGMKMVVDGCILVPLVEGPAFRDAQPYDLVSDVLLIDAPTLNMGAQVLRSIRAEFWGRSYDVWCASCFNGQIPGTIGSLTASTRQATFDAK